MHEQFLYFTYKVYEVLIVDIPMIMKGFEYWIFKSYLIVNTYNQSFRKITFYQIQSRIIITVYIYVTDTVQWLNVF